VQALLPRVCTTTLQGFQPSCSFCLAPPIQRKQAIDYNLAAGRAGRKDCRAPVAPAGRPGSSHSPRRAGQAPAALQRASARVHACCRRPARSANRPRRSCERCRPRARPAISSRRGNDQVYIKHPRTAALQRADGCKALLQGHAAHCSPPQAGQRGQCAPAMRGLQSPAGAGMTKCISSTRAQLPCRELTAATRCCRATQHTAHLHRQDSGGSARHQRPAGLSALDRAACPQRAAGELACWCTAARTHASRPERQG